MIEGYAAGLSIERKDNNGNYDKNNCVWIPMGEQVLNRRVSRKLNTPWGVLNLSDAARKIGIHHSALIERINNGWTYEKIFAPPLATNGRVRSDNMLNTPWGSMTILEAAKKIGIAPSGMYGRIRKNWPPEKLFGPPLDTYGRPITGGSD